MALIHKEGRVLLLVLLFIFTGIGAAVYAYAENFFVPVLVVLLVFYLLVLQFFRNPSRNTPPDELQIISPADGVIVAIERITEPEYFKDSRIQISVFMSPFNVHVNRFAISGKVVYFKYHPGKYLVASHPKSSTENERSTVVVEQNGYRKVLMRQIAGFVARRIITYCKHGDDAVQGKEFGFIKFGSRVDVIVPEDALINVQMGQKIVGGITSLATFAK